MERFSYLYDSGINEAMKLRKPFFYLNEKYAINNDVKKFESLIDVVTRKSEYLHEIDQMFVEKYMKDTMARMTDKKDKDDYTFMIKNFVRYNNHCLGVAFGEILPKYRRDMFISMYSENAPMFYKKIQENTKKTLILS